MMTINKALAKIHDMPLSKETVFIGGRDNLLEDMVNKKGIKTPSSHENKSGTKTPPSTVKKLSPKEVTQNIIDGKMTIHPPPLAECEVKARICGGRIGKPRFVHSKLLKQLQEYEELDK